jgi:hypothetical protein
MKTSEYFQQGDVTLTLVTKDKNLTTRLKNSKQSRSPVLQEGESTGHAHRIHGKSFMQYESVGWQNERYVELKKLVVLRHEEHKPIDLPPGLYKIGIVREYDHWTEAARRVVD